MKPEVATRRIEAFKKRFGEAHLYFAYHAAFPLALTPDLLYRLWANFQTDIHGENLQIPWLAVADFLLSSLCEEVSFELYELDTTVRNQLLTGLKGNPRFAEKRIHELSDFLLAYIKEQLNSHDPDIRDFAQAQRWTALAYTKPSEAARELASVLAGLKFEEKAEWIRMASVIETFAEPLAGFEPLLIYVRGMKSLSRGNQENAIKLFSLLRKNKNKEPKLQINDVILPIPELIIKSQKKANQLTDFKKQEIISFAFLKRIYNAFDPFRPLPAGDPTYVDCREVRGDGDILTEIGMSILLSDRMTRQLYGGHRGAGKSTELLRLRKYLEEQGCFVVYFEADEADIEPEDAQYTDILLACTRHLLDKLKDSSSPNIVLNWLKERWQDLQDVALTKFSLESLSVEAEIAEFAKITANLRNLPSLRHKIREKINPHTVTLIDVLNKFLKEAKKKLPDGKNQLVLIADNLDRIVPISQEDGRTNHEQIFLDRSEQLQNLDCHIIYTVPISLLYSNRAVDVTNTYGTPQVLPMIMIKTPDNQPYQRGINKLKEVLQKRLQLVEPNLSIMDIFEENEALELLCLMSGGHLRNLLLLMKEAIKFTDNLPITNKALQRSISELRNTYRNTIFVNEWEILAKVYQSKEIENNQLYRGLQFSRCILEYRYINNEGFSQVWYDIHPLIQGIKEFQDAYKQLNS